MLWTFSVHTAIYIKKGSVINVVCYERVCYEHGLLWKWCVFNRSVMNGSVVNVVCFEWSVMNGLLWTGLFWMGTLNKTAQHVPSEDMMFIGRSNCVNGQKEKWSFLTQNSYVNFHGECETKPICDIRGVGLKVLDLCELQRKLCAALTPVARFSVWGQNAFSRGKNFFLLHV